MDKNIKIARQLVRIAKSLMAGDLGNGMSQSELTAYLVGNIAYGLY